MAKSRSATSSDPAAALLVSAIADIVVQVVEEKCQKLKPRERSTLERRLGRTVETFVQGLRLSPDQRRANERLAALQSADVTGDSAPAPSRAAPPRKAPRNTPRRRRS